MQMLRASNADPVGIEGDAIVGATALAYGIPLITGDYALTNAVSKLGGKVRRL